MSTGVSLLTGNTAGAMSSLFGAAKGAFDMNRAHEKTKKTKTSPADVIMWSGCKDDQTVSRVGRALALSVDRRNGLTDWCRVPIRKRKEQRLVR
jgi:hypothetical protein